VKRLTTAIEAVARAAAGEGVAFVAVHGAPPAGLAWAAAAAAGVARCERATSAKLAAEVGLGAALAGARALVVLEALPDALEALGGAVDAGAAGLVVVVVDDPAQAVAASAPDSRALARVVGLPCLEPADPAECLEQVTAAFALSEYWETPVLVRLTARLALTARPLEWPPVRRAAVHGLRVAARDRVLSPGSLPRAEARRDERLAQLAAAGVDSELNRLELRSRALGVITAGVAYHHLREAVPEASVLKLGLTHPLPSELVREFAAQVQRLVVVEEMQPVLENELRSLGLACRGKDLVPRTGELTPDLLAHAVGGHVPGADALPDAPPVPERPPEACPGCPQRPVLQALKRLHVSVAGDPGCTALFAGAPLGGVDRALAPGAAAALVHGAGAVLGPRARGRQVALVGEGGFLHSGALALAHAAAAGDDLTVVVTPDGSGAGRGRDLAAAARALGAARVAEVDATDLGAVEGAVQAALRAPGLHVVVARGRCPRVEPAAHRARAVAAERCNRCGACLRLGCPALCEGDAAMHIDPALCEGCGTCAQVCRAGAVVEREATP
jgi:indolepyruvate ferredoxin oxidoreductase alpha subunit